MSILKSYVLPIAVVIAALVLGVSILAPRQRIPSHLLHHPLVDLPNFFSEQEVDDLLAFTRSMEVIPPLAREYDTYTPLMDNVGEAHPYNASVGCKVFTMPNGKKDKCVLPGRVDVGRHFILTGGPGALKEKYSSLVGRVFGFMKYIYDFNEHELPKRLLSSPKFVKLAKAVCPKEKQYLDPIQLNLVVQLPGQTVATHIDAPYFQRASRFHYPQWLLATMVFSGLFQDSFIHQVQVVGYYHKWTDTNRSGDFKFWNDENLHPVISKPISRSANSVDGSKVVHAADVYMPNERPPVVTDANVSVLRYKKGNPTGVHEWEVVVDDKVVRTYPEDHIRFSVVYRARCFEDEAAATKYHEDQKNPIPLEVIFDTFRKDLVKKGLMREGEVLTPYDFSILLLDTYIRYPLSPNAVIPYNYCALDRKYKWLTPLVDALCN